jgi:hypothetical protein
MTPFEIALSIRNRPDQDEAVEAYAARVHASERTADFDVAIELLIGWEQAFDDFSALLDCITSVARKDDTLQISKLIERKRKLGYDAKLEALLARRWRCPHCKQFACLSKVEVPIGAPGSLLRCVTCGEHGMYPVEAKARLDVHDGGKGGLRPI